MKKLILFLLFCYLSETYSQYSFIHHTDNQLSSKLDSIVHKGILETFPGDQQIALSLGIIIQDYEFYYNYGTVEKAKSILPTCETIYEIGSITKTFTGILLAQAILEEKIDPEFDIRNYLNGNYPNLEFEGTPINVIHLANHTSGLPEDIYPDTIMKMRNPTMFDFINLYEGDDGTMFLNNLHKVKLASRPGEKKQYSNTGIIILGIILENVYNMSYSALTNKYFSEVYGMTSTKIVEFKSDTANYTRGYDKSGKIMPHITFQIAGAAGGLLSTASDMLSYLSANMYEKDEAIKLSHKITFGTEEDGIGLCWMIDKTPTGEKQLWHNGGEPGFSSYCTVIPEKSIGFIGLTNQRGRQDDLLRLWDKIVSSF